MSVRTLFVLPLVSLLALLAGGCSQLDGMMSGGETGPLAVSAPATLEELGGGQYRVSVPVPDDEAGRATLAAMLDDPGDTLSDVTAAAAADAKGEVDDVLAEAAGERMGRSLTGDAVVQSLSGGSPAVVKFAGSGAVDSDDPAALVVACTYSRVDRSAGAMFGRMLAGQDEFAALDDDGTEPTDAEKERAADVMADMARAFDLHSVELHDPETGRTRTMDGERFLEVASLVVGRDAVKTMREQSGQR